MVRGMAKTKSKLKTSKKPGPAKRVPTPAKSRAAGREKPRAKPRTAAREKSPAKARGAALEKPRARSRRNARIRGGESPTWCWKTAGGRVKRPAKLREDLAGGDGDDIEDLDLDAGRGGCDRRRDGGRRAGFDEAQSQQEEA
jgi:hypothetical protein